MQQRIEDTTMTDKAKKIPKKMKRRRTLFRSPEARDRVLGEFNRTSLDEVGPIGGQGMRVLQEMNSLVDDHNEFVKSMAPV
jgi:hypothetical protein